MPSFTSWRHPHKEMKIREEDESWYIMDIEDIEG